MKKRQHNNTNQKKIGVNIWLSDKVDSRTKDIAKDKKEYLIVIMWLILKEDIVSLCF